MSGFTAFVLTRSIHNFVIYAVLDRGIFKTKQYENTVSKKDPPLNKFDQIKNTKPKETSRIYLLVFIFSGHFYIKHYSKMPLEGGVD